jgi:formamidopyrimidine-DNA glycosylase
VPELPEVEVLVRHLDPALRHKTIMNVTVRRPKVILPSAPAVFRSALLGARFERVTRRAKYLVFELSTRTGQPLRLVGHLGMTGRMYLQDRDESLPKHCSVVFDLGHRTFVFEDTRYFGKLTLNSTVLEPLGPEPLDDGFTALELHRKLKRSRQPVKVKLLDQTVLAGLGNIYASEALFRARISPRLPAARLTARQARRLWRSIREVIRQAIRCGSTVPLSFSGVRKADGLFYFGRAPGAEDYYTERLRVYDRAGRPCPVCRAPIRRIVQAARSTYYCTRCQR